MQLGTNFTELHNAKTTDVQTTRALLGPDHNVIVRYMDVGAFTVGIVTCMKGF